LSERFTHIREHGFRRTAGQVQTARHRALRLYRLALCHNHRPAHYIRWYDASPRTVTELHIIIFVPYHSSLPTSKTPPLPHLHYCPLLHKHIPATHYESHYVHGLLITDTEFQASTHRSVGWSGFRSTLTLARQQSMTLEHGGQTEEKIDMTERTISFTFVACSRTRTVYLFSLTFLRCLFSFCTSILIHPFQVFSSYIYIHLPPLFIFMRARQDRSSI
jgi:hypothetical protein